MSNKEIYVPSDEALKFIAFLRATGNEDNASPEAHYKIADILFSSRKKDKNVLIECSRGLGKSTVAEYAVIYAAALGIWPGFGKCPFIVFLGANQDGNVKQFFKNVASKIHNSELLSSLIDVKRQTDSEIELVNKEGVKMFIVGKGMNVNWRGARSPDGHRPSLLLADDVLHNDSATSEAVRNTIDTNWFSSALPALAPNHKIIYIGTPLNSEDLLHKLKNSGEYSVVRFPLCTEFPCSEEEYESVWPERFTYEYTRGMYNQFNNAGKAQNFYCEYMLEITDLSTLLVEEDDINWFDYTTFMKNKEKYNYYISTDFATSTKKSADYSTIGVWAIGSDDSWFLVDGQCKRQTMQDNLEDLFKYVHRWKPLSVGIESSGQQGGFISILQDMMMSRNLWFQLAKKRGSKEFGIRPIKDKVHRFVTGVQPKFKQGKIWFPKPEIIKTLNPYLLELLDEMVNELSKFTLAGGVKALAHDDCASWDTLIDTPSGSKMIKDVVEGDLVIAYNGRSAKVVAAHNPRMTGVKPIVNIELVDGTILKLSEFHPVLVGSKYVLARDIQVNDAITRNYQWKQQLNLTDLSGQKNPQGTTNPQLDVKMGQEKTGYISMFMKSIMEKLKLVMMFTTLMKTNKTTTSVILSYFQKMSTKQSTWNRIPETGTGLQNMLKKILMKFKLLQSSVEVVNTSERAKEEKNLNPQLNAPVVGQHLLLIKELEMILSSVVPLVEINGIHTTTQSKVRVSSVEEYLHQVLEGLSTVVMNAEQQKLKSRLEEMLPQYVSCAEKHSQELLTKLAVEKNALEIGKMNLSECTVSVKRVWVSSPEETYNFEVEHYHNYQVCDGIVIHNCLDLLNQLSEMDTIAPNNYEEDNQHTYMDSDGTMVTGIWDEDGMFEKNYNGSTVF